MNPIVVRKFGGVAPKVPARYLGDGLAQTALNCVPQNSSLVPLPYMQYVMRLPHYGSPRTIYRFGQDADSDTQYWFAWGNDVDVCRSQIAKDTSEWTFFTNPESAAAPTPRATYNQLALSGSSGRYPFDSIPLGLPAPETACSVTVGEYTPETHPATLTLSSYHISDMTVEDDLEVSLDGRTTWQTANITSGPTAASVASAINTVAGVSATVKSSSVEVTTDDGGEEVTLHIRYPTGEEVDPDAEITYGTDYGTNSGNTDTPPRIVIEDSEAGSISIGDEIYLKVGDTVLIDYEEVESDISNIAALRSWLYARVGSNLGLYNYDGACLFVTYAVLGNEPGDVIEYRRRAAGFSGDAVQKQSAYEEASSPAEHVFHQGRMDTIATAGYLVLTVNGKEHIIKIDTDTPVENLKSLLSGLGVGVIIYGTIKKVALIQTAATGTSATLGAKEGSYSMKTLYSEMGATGWEDEPEIPDSRVYIWTWVNKVAGFDFESAPAPASRTVDVYSDQSVNITGFSAPPNGYTATHKRLYRSANGTYLFVAEITAADQAYTDTVDGAHLGEEIPSMNWNVPPDNLKGLTNLPNGGMAGFDGRDIYMCEPYHPHAFPDDYRNSVDYPVVALGRMDTTLVALTKGTPYFLQGSHPDNAVVVQSDIEQACVSKRSVVSAGSAVLYASPDGLVMLSPGGSRVLTEERFTRQQWQDTFEPSTIHAYQHDRQYIAFSNGYGFIFDLETGQFVMHDIQAVAGFNDLRNDILYVVQSNRQLYRWMEHPTSKATYVWRSKKYTFPRKMFYSTVKVEAEDYPVTFNLYVDDTLVFTKSVTTEDPFRLPPIGASKDLVAKEWEFELIGDVEVYGVVIGQSMDEVESA